MGSLRFLLALSVFLSHTGMPLFGLKLVGFSVAVQSFFIISGFYMALILNEKYRGPGSYYLFITNRLLRLLPAYWVVLALTAAALYALAPFASGEPWITYNFSLFFPLLDLKAKVLLVLSNVFIIGQDLLRLFGIDPQGGFFTLTRDPEAPSGGFPPVYEFFFIPPAWSISTELMFYLVAPFLARGRKSVLFALVSASLLLRFVMFQYGYRGLVWQFQFFPSELAFFLLGVLSYRLYRARERFFSGRVGLYATVVVIGATLLYQFAPVFKVQGAAMNKWAYYAILISLIPAVFDRTKGSRIDKYLGDLSYPIYIVHYFVLWLWVLFRERLIDTAPMGLLHLGMLIVTLALAAAIFHFVIQPLEKLRQARVRRASAAPAPLDAG